MRLTNHMNLPQAVVNAMMQDEYSRGEADISVTGLTSPPRLQALREAHDDELEEDVADRTDALWGKALHHILELGDRQDTSTITERRYFMRVPGPYGEWTISGQMDSIRLTANPDGTVDIVDWKTAKVAEMVYGVKEEREQQLNIYKILLEANGFKVGKLTDYFFIRDWSKLQAAREKPKPTLTGGATESTYPDKAVVIHDVRIWSQEEAIGFILSRVGMHQEAQYDYRLALDDVEAGPHEAPAAAQSSLPECTEEERWARKSGFAVTKEGGKRASKVTDTRQEAEDYITAHPDTSYKVTEREGESIRCGYYCPVSSICEQWKEMRRVEA